MHALTNAHDFRKLPGLRNLDYCSLCQLSKALQSKIRIITPTSIKSGKDFTL